MVLPRPITKLIDYFERLPGIGPKTAQRLVFYLLHFPQEDLENFAKSLIHLKTSISLCSICKNVSEGQQCSLCTNAARHKNIIAVVASPLDVLAIEKTGFDGVYHVLHGVINPLSGVGPDELYIQDLIKRLSTTNPVELILATNTSMEGESTALYISKLVRESGYDDSVVKITRIARGLPVGGDIEYADDITLSRAFEGRSVI